jgi:hypothetical protein
MLKFLSTKNLLVAFYLCSFWSISHAQINEYYFHENEGKEGNTIKSHIKVGDYLIVGGSNFERNGLTPVVTKIDTLGNIVWETYSPEIQLYSGRSVVHLMYSEGNLYAVTSDDKIWKLDENTGDILWLINMPAYYSPEIRIFDVDSNTFAAYYQDESNILNRYNFDLINKNDGKVIQSQYAPLNNTYTSISAIKNNDLYKTKGDFLFKSKVHNIDTIVWETDLNMDDNIGITDVYVDANSDVFVFVQNANDNPLVVRVNNQNGTIMWHNTIPQLGIQDYEYSNHADENGYLYITWKQITSDIDSYKFYTTKIDKNTGLSQWQSMYNFGPKDDGGLSVAVDDNNDVFISGYINEYNPLSGFGIVKLNGNTGATIYGKRITTDSINAAEVRGLGAGAYVINNRPYFLGNLQTDLSDRHIRTKPAFVALNSESGAVNILKTYDGHYQFRSKTVDIQQLGDMQFAMLKQVGRYTKVEVYDASKNLLWEKSFRVGYYLEAKQMEVDSFGNILVCAYSHMEASSNPFYYAERKEVQLFAINKDGQIIKEHTIENNNLLNDNSRIVCTTQGSYFVYPFNGDIHAKDIINSQSTYDEIIWDYEKFDFEAEFVKVFDDKILLYLFNEGPSIEDHQTIVLFDTKTKAIIPFEPIVTDSLIEIYRVEVIGKNKLLFIGADNTSNPQRKRMLYDVGNARFLWSAKSSLLIEGEKFFYDATDEVIYAYDYRQTFFNTFAVDMTNGEFLWTYMHSAFYGNDIFAKDFCVDIARKKITITGYEKNEKTTPASGFKWQKLFILTLDLEGSLIDLHIELNDTLSGGYCAHILPDKSVWVGGELSRSDSLRSGFIFEMDSSLFVPEDPELTDDPEIKEEPNNVEIIATYPVPFIGELNIKVKVKQDNSNIETSIYNLEGVLLYTFNKQAAVAGDYYIKLDASELTGINILIVRTNDEVYRHQILGLNKLEE